MNTIKSFRDALIENKYFFIPLLIFSIIGLIIIIQIPKGDVLLWVNSYHNSFLDIYFLTFSAIGSGIYFLFLLIILAFFSIRYIIFGLIMFLGSGLIIQILKHSFLMPRPSAWFESDVLLGLNLVEGVKLYSKLSFPSGHSASGFAIFLFLAIIIKNKYLGAFFFVLALSVAFARVYLVQHFFIDIYFGSIIGAVSALYFYVLIESNAYFKNAKWFNFSLIQYIKNRQSY